MHNVTFSTSEVTSATIQRLKNGLKKCLDSADLDMNQIEGFDEVFAESVDLCKATKTFSLTSVDGNWKQCTGYVVRAK